jgi:hypothetical protein
VHIAKHRRDGIFKFLSYLPVLYTKIIKRRWQAEHSTTEHL